MTESHAQSNITLCQELINFSTMSVWQKKIFYPMENSCTVNMLTLCNVKLQLILLLLIPRTSLQG